MEAGICGACVLERDTDTFGASWENRSNWRNADDTDFNAPGSECTWYGVTCDPAQNHVITLDLRGNQRVGSLPALSALNQLQILDVGQNRLTGSIPPLTGLGQLQELSTSTTTN